MALVLMQRLPSLFCTSAPQLVQQHLPVPLFWDMGTARSLSLLLGTSQLPQTGPAKSCYEPQSPGMSGGGL